MTIGFTDMHVKQIEFASKDLPKAFDGYRIVQFSDAHIATYDNIKEDMGQQIVNTINDQKADMIVFTGDLQNLRPDELEPKVSLFQQLHAPDGVYSILGNHDYATYLDCDEATKKKNDLKTQQAQDVDTPDERKPYHSSWQRQYCHCRHGELGRPEAYAQKWRCW